MTDRVYFPPLEQCLNGETALISWKHVASALSAESPDRLTSQAVSSFLRDPYVLQLFKNPAKVFEPPSSRSKSELETKTAAINLTPTPHSKYDIKVIKEDAQWLSRSANVNEVAALRLVVLSFHAAPQSHLLGPLSTQDVVNVQEAAGISSRQSSALLASVDTAATADAEAIWSTFEKEDSRRRRLLSALLSERRSFMVAADHLLTFLLHNQQHLAGPDTDALRRAILKEAFGIDEEASVSAAPFQALLPSYLDILPRLFEDTQTTLQSLDDKVLDIDLERDWVCASLTEAIHSMTVIFQVLDLLGQSFAAQKIVSQWFDLVAKFRFFEDLEFPDDVVSEMIFPLRTIVCAISLSLINLSRSVAYLDQEEDLGDDEDAYLTSSDALGHIHDAIVSAAVTNTVTASPVIFGWSLILHRMHVAYQERVERRDLLLNQRAQDRFELELEYQPQEDGRRSSAGSIVSMEKSPYDLFLVNSALDRDIQPVEELARAVTAQGLVYDLISDMSVCLGGGQQAAFRPLIGSRVRLVFLDLLKASFPIVGYLSEPVTALLAVLGGGQQYWDISKDRCLLPEQDVAAVACQDPAILEFYIFQSLNRYPYEFLPFASLCRVLSSSPYLHDGSEMLLDILVKTRSLTFAFDDKWSNYELAQEAENSNTIRLLKDEQLFSTTSSRRRPLASEEVFCIPRGTLGRFVTDRGKVVLLDYEHSTLALLGKRLEVNTARDVYKAEPLGFLQSDETAEAVNLLATLLRSTVLRETPEHGAAPNQVSSESGIRLLREASKAISQPKDIITVVCDLLDNAIQGDLADSEGADITVISACLCFLHAALPLAPGRIWSYMSRSELLNSESKAGCLSRITRNLDILAERYEVLVSSIKLFVALVDNVISSAIQRKVGTRSVSRQRMEEDPWLGTSDKILSRICLSMIQTCIDVYENSATWRFESEVHRSVVVKEVVSVMDTTIAFSFGVGAPSSQKGLTACLLPAARYAADNFLSIAPGSLRLQPLLASLIGALQVPDTALYPKREDILVGRVLSVLKFATDLLRVADYLDRPSTTIQTQLFKVASLIARISCVRDALKLPALSLLGALVESTARGNNEPPSLLGYLGSHISRSFIQILSNLDKPFNRSSTTRGIWTFFSTIMRNRQQWMANCLLTGKTPREALQGDGKLGSLSADSTLYTALENLKSIATLPGEEALAILDFLNSAQNYWPWTIFAMAENQSYLDALRGYVRELKSPSLTVKSAPKRAAFEARIASYIAETFAMQLYHLRQTGKEADFASAVINDLDYFLRDGVQVAGYNNSLHANFARNFAAKYPGCTLEDFRRTLLAPRELGTHYYYALDYADAMLNHDASWLGPRQNGFRHEMETANLNLSLVDAQIALFHAWEYLLLELSVCLLPRNSKLPKQLLQVVEKCLESNQDLQGPEEIFLRITQSRANLCLVLLQRLTEASQLPRDISRLLSTVSTTLNSVESPFESSQIHYYRTLLKTLYVVLRGSAHAPRSETMPKESSVALSQLVLNILDRNVAQGFRSLVALVHEPDSAADSEDMALITAILQACLSIPSMDQCQTQILNIMASTDVLHVAVSLYSWADKLAVKGDPVYGELSLLFLLELSGLPVVAEQLACDGLLGHLTSASLAGFLRRPNVSPFSDNIGATRCYGIWAKGILPILLNMLSALGATIAPEVAVVLNQFPNLLRSSVERLEAPGMSRTPATTASRGDGPLQYVTLLAVSEAHSLALLTRVLAALRANNNRDIPEVAWDGGVVLENVEFWLSSRKVLRERLLPLGGRESEWRARKATEGSGCENKLEEKVVAQLEAVKTILSEEL